MIIYEVVADGDAHLVCVFFLGLMVNYNLCVSHSAIGRNASYILVGKGKDSVGSFGNDSVFLVLSGVFPCLLLVSKDVLSGDRSSTYDTARWLVW
jgi:hypothetical protein